MARQSSPITRMSLCVLGSGSGGNCSALVLNRRGWRHPQIVLIDLGLSIRQTRVRLEAVGLKLSYVSHALITHFDRDHFQEVWLREAHRSGMAIRFHLDHWGWANQRGAMEADAEPFDGSFQVTPGLEVTSVRTPHDADGTTAYRLQSAAGRIGYATDLGRVGSQLLESFTDLDLLAIESNYCPQMQLESSRPKFLKQRIMGGRGHLSNQESFDAVRDIETRCTDLKHIVLLHLSRQCNCPERVHDQYGQAPHLRRRLTLSHQRNPTPLLHLERTTHVQSPLWDDVAGEAAPTVLRD